MEDATERVRQNLAHVVGDITFKKPNRIEILAHNIYLAKEYIKELKRELPAYSDIPFVEVNLVKEERFGKKSMKYTLEITPEDNYPLALNHLPPITRGFLREPHRRE